MGFTYNVYVTMRCNFFTELKNGLLKEYLSQKDNRSSSQIFLNNTVKDSIKLILEIQSFLFFLAKKKVPINYTKNHVSW